MNINLEEYAFAIHSNAVEKGFWSPLDRMEPQDHVVFYIKQLAMIDSEVAETLEAVRKDKGEREVVFEMADILIRLLDLWAGMQRNGEVRTLLTDALVEKMAANMGRPQLHGVRA
jgi:hypothetical protein